jgi:hypothetical protein
VDNDIFKRKGIILFLEYQAFSPSSALAPPSSLPQESVPPLEKKGANSDDWRESVALCILCVLKYYYLFVMNRSWKCTLYYSVADPDPPDPHVFGPPGSESGIY